MSGIYIPGMEMPTNCGACPFHKLWSLEDPLQCLVNLELWCDSPERHKLCPLIPVPEHGDLIDRDEFVVKLRLKRARVGVGYTSNAITMCIKDANDMPTIIPASGEEQT